MTYLSSGSFSKFSLKTSSSREDQKTASINFGLFLSTWSEIFTELLLLLTFCLNNLCVRGEHVLKTHNFFLKELYWVSIIYISTLSKGEKKNNKQKKRYNTQRGKHERDQRTPMQGATQVENLVQHVAEFKGLR